MYGWVVEVLLPVFRIGRKAMLFVPCLDPGDDLFP
jgi:hypothetical protein